MLRPSILLFYNFQSFVILLHLYPSSRHIYMILIGLGLQRLLSLFLYTRMRFLIGSILILLYLQYPFLYFLSFSYILTNTYYSTSLLVKSKDLSYIVYYTELCGGIISFIIHVDYSVIYLLFMLDLVLTYFKIPPPYEERKFQDILESVKHVVTDVHLRKKEYRIILSEYNFVSVYDERRTKESRIEHRMDEEYNIVEGNKVIEKEGKGLNRSPFYISLDVFTPLIILKKDMFSLLLLILRTLPSYRMDYLYFLFIFLYLMEYRLISLIVSVFSDFSNIGNINSRMISTVVFYYLLKDNI